MEWRCVGPRNPPPFSVAWSMVPLAGTQEGGLAGFTTRVVTIVVEEVVVDTVEANRRVGLGGGNPK